MGIDNINKDDLCVVAGCCCSYSLLFLEIPACIGATVNGECLCLGQELCLEQGHPPILCDKKSDQWCQIGLYICGCYAKPPSTLCKQAGHCFCCVGECSFPPEGSMPCILAVYGLMCAPKFGCCVRWKEVKK